LEKEDDHAFEDQLEKHKYNVVKHDTLISTR